MTALLDRALEAVRGLSPEAQDDIARVVLRLSGAGAAGDWTTTRNRSARSGGGVALHGRDRLPVAADTEGFSPLFDDPGLFLPLVARRHAGPDQPCAGYGRAREGRARSQPERWRDRQPVAQDHGKRRSARV